MTPVSMGSHSRSTGCGTPCTLSLPYGPPLAYLLLTTALLTASCGSLSQAHALPIDAQEYYNGLLDEPDYIPNSYPSAPRAHGAADEDDAASYEMTSYLGRLVQAILETDAEGTAEGYKFDPYSQRSDIRAKRPGGLLGLDNLDFAATTLDRARLRSKVPMETDWDLARTMTQLRPTQTVPNPGHLSLSVTLTDLRRMLINMNHMIKAGR